jgi:hypothetical protein
MRKLAIFLFLVIFFVSCKKTRNVTVENVIVEKDSFSLTETEFRKYLESTGKYCETEIKGFLQIKKEVGYLKDFVGKIIWLPGHFVYQVKGVNYDGYQTINACGIWSVRRKLRHMEYLKIFGIQKGVWYNMSDRQIRNLLATQMFNGHSMCLNEDIPDIEGTGFLSCESLVNLQQYYGIPRTYAIVVSEAYLGHLYGKGIKYLPIEEAPSYKGLDYTLEDIGVVAINL